VAGNEEAYRVHAVDADGVRRRIRAHSICIDCQGE